LAEVEKLINENLLGEWAIRIEHTADITPGYTRWQQWGETLYAVSEAANVLGMIDACRTSYPTSVIRIHAERFRPPVQFYYCVYGVSSKGRSIVPMQYNHAIVNVRKSGWIPGMVNKINVAPKYFVHAASLIGVLIASLLIFESTAS
jgi:hypothetical protein